MFDARLRPLIDPPLNALGLVIGRMGITANMLTATGLAIGLCGAWAIAQGAFGWGLALILANRLIDGLDGAVARLRGPTDFGGYLDILADFVFYVSIPLAFCANDPANLLPTLILISSFVLTGTSFLAYAAIAAKRGEETSAHGRKSFFYSTGIAEGGETILAFALMALVPQWFAPLAYGYAALCGLTVIQRSALAWISFR